MPGVTFTVNVIVAEVLTAKLFPAANNCVLVFPLYKALAVKLEDAILVTVYVAPEKVVAKLSVA